MKALWIVVLSFLSAVIITSGFVQAKEQVPIPEYDYFLAISFTDKDPNLKKFEFKKSTTGLTADGVVSSLKKIEGVHQVALYKDSVAITRKAGAPWEELEKKVMLVLKDYYKLTGYVLVVGDKLSEEQRKRLLTDK
jgi:hypothetical protein